MVVEVNHLLEDNMSDSLRIKTLPVEERSEWRTLDQWRVMYSEEELVEMLHRYSDTQEHAKSYRVRASETQKLAKMKLEALAREKGLSVKEFISSSTMGK